MSGRTSLDAGAVFEVAYPFTRDSYTIHDGDEDGGWTETEIPTWKPGTRHEDVGQGDTECIADALGRMVLTVVSLHKPGKYPARVFFTRTWRDPDGKPFGKTKCRVTTVAAFRTLCRGYRHPFVLRECICDGCEWPHCDHRMQGWTKDAEVSQ